MDLLADTIGIIRDGKLLTELPIEEIHKHQTDYISLQVDDVTSAAALLEGMGIKNFSVLIKNLSVFMILMFQANPCQKPSLRMVLVWRASAVNKTHWKISFQLTEGENKMAHLIKLELKNLELHEMLSL